MLPPVNGQARWFRVTAAGNPALLERYKSGFGAIVKLQAQAPAEATEPVAAASAARPQDRRAEVERAIHAGPGEGVKPEQIDTVLFSWAQVYRVTGLQYEETIYLLLKDGSAYRDLTLPPQDLNAEAAHRLQSERWVSWRKSGGKYQVRGARDADWRTLQAWPAVPGRHDERLAQTFSHAWYASMGGLGGSAGRDSLVFRPDGRFEQIGYSSHGTGVVQASNGFAGGSVTTRDKQGTRTSVSVSATGTDQFDTPVVAGGSSSRRNDGAAQTGSYRIDGWSIELRRDNGAVERKLFLFTGDKRDAINVGGVGYSLPSKQK
jgi:hypothetical protein